MATLRAWLRDAGYRLETGRIIYHHTTDPNPGYARSKDIESRQEIGWDHPILDHEFDEGYGLPDCPRVVAEDADAYYFPAAYDGATRLETLHKDLDRYLSDASVTPYVGARGQFRG